MLGLQAKEIADVEARIAELERQLAAARGEIDALEARLAEVEAAADAAEAERNAANDAFVDPDIALLREHYDKYQHWFRKVRLTRGLKAGGVQARPRPSSMMRRPDK